MASKSDNLLKAGLLLAAERKALETGETVETVLRREAEELARKIDDPELLPYKTIARQPLGTWDLVTADGDVDPLEYMQLMTSLLIARQQLRELPEPS